MKIIFFLTDPNMSRDPGKCFVVHCRGKPTRHKNRDVDSAASPSKSLKTVVFIFESKESP